MRSYNSRVNKCSKINANGKGKHETDVSTGYSWNTLLHRSPSIEYGFTLEFGTHISTYIHEAWDLFRWCRLLKLPEARSIGSSSLFFATKYSYCKIFQSLRFPTRLSLHHSRFCKFLRIFHFLYANFNGVSPNFTKFTQFQKTFAKS